MTDKVSYALDFLQEFDSVSWYQKEFGIVLDYIIELEDLVKFLKTLNQESVLDKIKAEIDQKQYYFMDDKDYDEGIRFGLMLAYQTIDKYKTESEGEE